MSTDFSKIDRFLKAIDNIILRPGLYAINRVEDIEFIVTGYGFALAELPDSDEFFKLLGEFNKICQRKV